MGKDEKMLDKCIYLRISRTVRAICAPFQAIKESPGLPGVFLSIPMTDILYSQRVRECHNVELLAAGRSGGLGSLVHPDCGARSGADNHSTYEQG